MDFLNDPTSIDKKLANLALNLNKNIKTSKLPNSNLFKCTSGKESYRFDKNSQLI